MQQGQRDEEGRVRMTQAYLDAAMSALESAHAVGEGLAAHVQRGPTTLDTALLTIGEQPIQQMISDLERALAAVRGVERGGHAG